MKERAAPTAGREGEEPTRNLGLTIRMWLHVPSALSLNGKHISLPSQAYHVGGKGRDIQFKPLSAAPKKRLPKLAAFLSPKNDIYGQRMGRTDKECRQDPGTGPEKRELPAGIQTRSASDVTTSCTCHSLGLWMVNWLPVPSNNHPVTRATTLIQWQKLFQAPEPKLSSQIAPHPPKKKNLFPLPFLWPFLLSLFTTSVYHQNLSPFP